MKQKVGSLTLQAHLNMEGVVVWARGSVGGAAPKVTALARCCCSWKANKPLPPPEAPMSKLADIQECWLLVSTAIDNTAYEMPLVTSVLHAFIIGSQQVPTHMMKIFKEQFFINGKEANTVPYQNYFLLHSNVNCLNQQFKITITRQTII